MRQGGEGTRWGRTNHLKVEVRSYAYRSCGKGLEELGGGRTGIMSWLKCDLTLIGHAERGWRNSVA